MSAADKSGLSERQRKNALRVANLPTEEFEAAVESPHPPTVTELAARGTHAKPVPSSSCRTNPATGRSKILQQIQTVTMARYT